MAKSRTPRPTPNARKPKAKPFARTTPGAAAPTAGIELTGEELRRLIAESAYYRAERRGFQPGQEFEDWLQAESEVRERLARGAAVARNQ